MRKIREILRLHLGAGLSLRQVARSASLPYTSVHDVIERAKAANLRWPLPDELDEAALARMMYPGQQGRPRQRPEPDWNRIDRELRQKGVTLALLWLEHKREHPDAYQYSQFCEHYRRWQRKLDVVLRQEYRAGEKLFVDYAGKTIPIVDPRTGVVQQAHVFVAVLGASNYTYAEAHLAQDLPSWIGGHCRAFAFFGGVPEVAVPDNLKSGVKHPSWYEPELNPTYAELAQHYGIVVLPARPKKPRDKAKVEAGVQVVERWIIAALRHRIFTSLDELNRAIWELLDRLNERPFKKREGCRRSLFEALDKPALKPLPATPYAFAQWLQAKVNIDYHVEVDHNYYSVPYPLVGQTMDVRLGDRTVEAFHRGRRVASHVRLSGKGRYSTDPAHRPRAHQQYLDWSPSRLIRWAESIGPHAARLVETILRERPHPEQGYRRCLGILGLTKYYGRERIEAAAERALLARAHSYRSLKSILENGLDRTPLRPAPAAGPVVVHVNVRGATYFAEGGNLSRC